MPRFLTLIAAAIITAAITLTPGAAVADESTAYADGFSYATNGSGSASARPEADRAGNLKVSAAATGGTKFRIPALKLLPYTSLTSGQANAYISDGIDGNPGVEEGKRYRISVTFGGLDVEKSTTGTGNAIARVHAQASNGVDAAGHTTIVGSTARDVTADGSSTLVFDVRPVEDGPIGVQAEVQVFVNAKGPGNSASAVLSSTISDVSITELG